MNDACKIAPIAGIFNLAGQLADALIANQTATTFAECMAPKALATQHLDELSRKMCRDLRYFVVFSSISSGLGNAGQSNYGMANAVMERIIEQRYRDGLPAKAIQLGAIGDVGLFYDLFLKKTTNPSIFEMPGGVLPQSITSLLYSLDILIHSPDPIVNSMVMSEKNLESTSKVGLIEKLRSKYGIPANTPPTVTLIELGVDSFSFLEIQQEIERETGIQIELEGLKTMTLQNITELVKGELFSQAINLDETSAKKTALAKLLEGSQFEKYFKTKIIKVNNISEETSGGKCVLVIPGIDGITSIYHYVISKSFRLPAFALHYFHTYDCASIRDIVELVYKVSDS